MRRRCGSLFRRLRREECDRLWLFSLCASRTPPRAHRKLRQAAEQLHLLRNRIARKLEIREAAHDSLDRPLGVLLGEKRADATVAEAEAQVAGVVASRDVEGGGIPAVECARTDGTTPIELVHGD